MTSMFRVLRMSRHIIVVCFLMFCTVAYGQQKDAADKALDRYELVCNRLIELRDAIRRGETISTQEVSSLMAEVRSIRSNLQKVPQGLTAEQTRRFNRIRRSYNYGPEVESFPRAQAVSAVPLTAYVADSIRQELAGVRYGRYVGPDKRHYEYAIGKTGIFFLAQISPTPEIAFGAGIGVLKSKGGAYLSFLGNFKSMSSDLEVLSDGTSSGSPVWLSGGKEKTKMVFTAGGLLRLSDNVSVLAGAGYGTRQLFWENSSGQWMKVTDCSYSGVAAEAGILLTLGRWNSFCLSAKAGTISFKYADFSIGIGYRF